MTSFTTSGFIRGATSLLFWLMTIAAILFMAQVFLTVDARSHSASYHLSFVVSVVDRFSLAADESLKPIRIV